MSDTMTPGANGTGFMAPVRNRYFYGKLLDVHHLEMEQRYFLEASRLINRLTLGSGVLCGLRVQALDGNRVAVSPGVAVDGQGREIMVTERVVIELDSLDKESGEGSTGREGTVLCLSYHECDVEPSPVLVADCELREDCAPGAVRERYKFALMDAEEAPFPEDPCSVLGRRPEAADEPVALPRPAMETRLRASLTRLEIGPREVAAEPAAAVATSESMRERLCAVFQPPCGPGPDCVPVALLVKGDDGQLDVRECPARRTIYSNAVLLDLILCLAERVDECCNRRIALNAPKVTELWPPPGADVALAEFPKAPLNLEEGGIAVSFDRDMNRERLEAPDEWLRVILVPDLDSTIGVPLALELDRVGPKTLGGETAGQTAYYKVVGVTKSGVLGGLGRTAATEDISSVDVSRQPSADTSGDTSTDTPAETRKLSLTELLKLVSADSARALVLMRSDDVTQIAAKDDAELLDADFQGTLLTSEECDLLWTLQAVAVGFGALLKKALATPPAPMPSLPSGNGIEGGVFHSSFHITTG